MGFYFISDLSTGPNTSLLFGIAVCYLMIVGLLFTYFLLDDECET